MITEVNAYYENGPFVDVEALYEPVRKAQAMRDKALRIELNAWDKFYEMEGSYKLAQFRSFMTDIHEDRVKRIYKQYCQNTHGVTIATIRRYPSGAGMASHEVIDNSWAFEPAA